MLINRILGDYRNPWCQICYDPVSLGTIAVGALASAGAGYGVSKLTASKAAPVVPTLQPTLAGPDPTSPQTQQDTQNSLSLLGAVGRDSTNLTRRRGKARSFLDEGSDAAPSPAYTNTTLGG